MTWFSFQTNLLSLLTEYVGILYFFGSFEKRGDGLQRHFAALFLLPLLVIYFPIFPLLYANNLYSFDNFINQILRTGINIFAVFGYVYCAKDVKANEAAYAASVFVLIYMVCFNIRQELRPLIVNFGEELYEGALVLIMAAALMAALAIAKKLLDLKNIRGVGASRWAMIAPAIFVELYFKWSLISPDARSEQRTWDVIFYALCATVGIFALVLIYEISEKSRREQEKLELENMRIGFENSHAKRSLQANSDICRLYHDMKNHILAIQGMANSEQLQSYLAELSREYENFESLVLTGNGIVDSLLSEKIRMARLKNVRFNVCLALNSIDYIQPVDIVTIFGNAVDNAVEAVEGLENVEERIVYIKSGEYANMVVIRFSNRYAGTREETEGVLKTAKTDSYLHGIGLTSIRMAVERCKGSMEAQFDNSEGVFRLIVMLPKQD